MSTKETGIERHPAQVGATFSITHDLIDASSRSLGSHQAQLDQTAAFRKFGEAAVNCKFSKIEWGQFETKEACLVCVDVSVSWSESYKLDYARLDLVVQEDGSQGSSNKATSSVPLPKISQVFGPKDPPLEGPRFGVERSSENNLQFQVPTPIGQVGTPSRNTKESSVGERLWRIVVVTEPAPKDREQRILRCRMQGNTRTQIAFPDMFRLGLIVEHLGNPFVIRFALQGSVVGFARAAVLLEDAFTFGGKKLSKVDYSFRPETSSKVLTSSEFIDYLNEVNGRLHGK